MSIQVFEILEQTFDNLPEYLLFELDGYTPDSKLPNDIKEGTSIIQESCHELIHEYIETWDNNYIKGYMRELIYLCCTWIEDNFWARLRCTSGQYRMCIRMMFWEWWPVK